MKGMKVIEGEDNITVITFGAVAKADFYDVNPTGEFAKLRKTIGFKTISLKPSSKVKTINLSDGSYIPIVRRQDELGHTINTSLKDILSYLDGDYLGEFTVNEKGTKVKFLKGDFQ